MRLPVFDVLPNQIASEHWRAVVSGHVLSDVRRGRGARSPAIKSRKNLRLLLGVDGETEMRTSDAQGRGSSMTPALQDFGQRGLPAAGRARGDMLSPLSSAAAAA